MRIDPDPFDRAALLLSDDDFYPEDYFSADPAIRAQYQTALGGFVMAFNQLDDLVTRLVGHAYDVIKRPFPRNLARTYAAKVDLLDTMGGMKVLQLDTAPIDELRDIGKMRNFLVHGYFDQNPLDGSYKIAPVNGAKPDHVKSETIDGWSLRALRAWEQLRLPEAAYTFRHIVVS